MNTFIISYDLRNQRNYEELYNAIKEYWVWAKVLESLWIVKTSYNSSEIYDYLSQYIDNDDGLIVIKSWREAKWSNVNCSNEWLKENL